VTRDVFKTIVGLTIIATVVITTFMYGNAQRKNRPAESRPCSEYGDYTLEQMPARCLNYWKQR
jgi:hypothetical protein